MNNMLYDLHLAVGRKCGVKKTCGKKKKFPSEKDAEAAASFHNNWKNKRHDVEHYPCPFCGFWHIGRKMSFDELVEISLR